MRIMIDDAADLPADLAEQENIYIVPVNIMFGTEEFRSGPQMTKPMFYEKVKSVGDHNFPKTSQPTPYQFLEAFEEVIAAGDTEIYCVTVSKKLSGTYASAIAARDEIGERATIHIFDSYGASAAQGFMGLKAARMFAQGASVDEVTARLTRMREEMAVIFMIDTLEYAVKGGRVGSLRGTFASLLNIKPIMKLHDGEVVEEGRVRTPKKARTYVIDRAKEMIGDRPVMLAAIHANVPDGGEEILRRAAESFESTERFLVDLTIPVAINLGPGALGLIAIPDD